MAKTTKNTDDKELEDLEATFATDDSPMTQFTEEGTGEAEPSSPKEETKKKSSNLMIYAIGGTLIAGLIGYKVLGAMNAVEETQPVVQQQAQQQQDPNQLAQQQAPAPVIPPVQQQPAVDPNLNTNPNIAQNQTLNQPINQSPLITGANNGGNSMMQPPSVDLNASQTAPTVAQAPNLNATVNPQLGQGQNPGVRQNQTTNSVAGINELKDAFNAQNAEFKTVLTDVGSHLEKIDGQLAQQQDVNKGFDKRITALEKGKPRRVASVSQGGTRSASSGQSSKKQGSILIDKSQQASRSNFEMNDGSEKMQRVASRQVEAEPQPRLMNDGSQRKDGMRATASLLEVHAIYSGRLWIKNSDNTLSTYAVGETLPNGEVIHRVDNEKLEVTTNRRTIRAQ